ncbi:MULTISPECIES: aminoacyltransferase [unclassified Streptococcus]|jgi:beta-lactam resistance factor|uniref:Lipid II:glycine glycyltransferase n=1 Tax=Streptococcus oralis TaxID=1303 RepID=A0A6N3ARJ3_STROR|nr:MULTISPECIES: aminoacyltransferase [unclassified Streptococcus]MCF4964212.1 aminoacyltransferase [Streptococcus sp. GS001]RSK05237.1 Lipid II:glycine glycyltransferase [Streptococcus sp. A12]
MYSYKIGITAEEHDEFVKNSPQTNLLQSSDWANIKDNWGNERLGIYQDQKLVAVASILIQPLPLGFTMLYIPRGPIMDYQNSQLVSFMLQSIKTYAKSKRAVFAKFDPSLFLRKGLIGQEAKDQEATLAIIQSLKECGVEWIGRTEDMGETIQPRFQANIYKEYFTEDQLSKSTKQAIRTARNKGVEVIFGGTELLDEFAALMKKTEARKGIHLRGKDYYEKLLTTYAGQSYITLSRINLAQRLASLKEQLEKNQAEASRFNEKTKPGKIDNNRQEKERLEEEIQFLHQELKGGQEIVSLSGTLTLEFGGTSENVYAGMDENFRRYQPAILTWYETAQHAFDRGADWQNMGGVENHLDGGLYHFKSKFNPMIEEFVGEFNLPTSILYPLVNKAYQLRKKLRNKQ